MQDQILQNILTRIDSVSTESALKDPVRFHPSLQPAVELFQMLEDTSSTYGDELTEVYYERRAAERETGLSWQTSYRENIKEGLFSEDRKSTRLNSSHVAISYAVFCLKKKNKKNE